MSEIISPFISSPYQLPPHPCLEQILSVPQLKDGQAFLAVTPESLKLKKMPNHHTAIRKSDTKSRQSQMLVRIQNSGNSLLLPLWMQMPLWKIVWQFLRKSNIVSPCQGTFVHLGCSSMMWKLMPIWNLHCECLQQRYHNCPKLATFQISFNKWMDK